METRNWQGPSEWHERLELLSLGLHGRNRWRLPITKWEVGPPVEHSLG